jgi:hypothetical protein
MPTPPTELKAVSTEAASEPALSPGLRALRTGLLIAGSALFGGLAVAFWHRKALTKLRQPVEYPEQPSSSPDAEDT